MQKDTDSEPDYDDSWMHADVQENVLKRWQLAISDYMSLHYIVNPMHLNFNVDLVKKLIPHVGVRDHRWKGFPQEDSNPAEPKLKLLCTIW